MRESRLGLANQLDVGAHRELVAAAEQQIRAALPADRQTGLSTSVAFDGTRGSCDATT